MGKIKTGFIIIAYPKNIEIYVDVLSGNKYLMTGHEYHEGDNYCSGLTQMLDESGKPDRYTKEEIEYLKSIATDITIPSNHSRYSHDRRDRREVTVAYYYYDL